MILECKTYGVTGCESPEGRDLVAEGVESRSWRQWRTHDHGTVLPLHPGGNQTVLSFQHLIDVQALVESTQIRERTLQHSRRRELAA